MSFVVQSYAAQSCESDLAPHSLERRTLREDDVKIDILYCGVCHSDLHCARNDWGFSQYPLVPGHEIVGRVAEIGPKVTRYKIGDLVGVGCLVDSCRDCGSCERDLEQYCEKGHTQTYGGVDRHDGTLTAGGYSQKIVVSQDFVLKVPENLELQEVPPLLCAGITTWSPLKHWKVGEGSRVAVIGLGGLGHMAIKLADALGAEVTLLTRSPHKAEDALKMGADEVLVSTDPEQMKKVISKFDLIIDTVPYAHDLNPYISTLALDGTLVLVGLLGHLDPSVYTVPMIMGRRSIAGSVIGGIAETQELLDFCGEHNITCDIEMIKMQEINEAYERMLKSDVKYRFVIDISSLDEE